MKKISEFICKKKYLILILTILLAVISLVGIHATKINYDILVYLPEDIETMKGQKILTEDFEMGAFSITVVENMPSKELLKLEDQIRNIDGVLLVESASDLVGTTIPLEMLPSEIVSKVHKDNTDLLLITFKDGTSSEATTNAVSKIREITSSNVKVGGMSAMVLDTRELSDQEITIYILIAVGLCAIILMISLDSYFVPVLLLSNIGIAILFNMGSNVFLGEISYITKAISAVLQLGVTTDFSIFLYHRYEELKKNSKNREDAMSKAIMDTFTSVIGSSFTTIAGFLALCAMNLTLGKDIGLVMAKGVLCGVICVLTVFPALLLVFDNIVEKTSHKIILPKFEELKDFIIKNYKVIFIIFIILILPAYLGNKHTESYYNLDKSLPDTLDSSVANKILKEDFGIVSPEIILIDKDLSSSKISAMCDEILGVEGIDFVLNIDKLNEYGITKNMLSDDLLKKVESDKYQMILINSSYDIATDELNNQVTTVNEIIKKYDSNAILAGEGPLMKDLVEISNQDFINVNYSSIIIIFIIMLIILKSLSLPVILVSTVEFAIILNMAIPYYMGVKLPFIASIVIGTIQLGATIDYAILMTTKYLEARKKMDKKSSVKYALDGSVSSIIVSALCFFGATFGVGIYSKLEMISSLCILIARGAIISMIVVIFVLPALLIIFDKLICKTTLGMKGRKKNE